jgi:hypothetical protein
VTHTCASPYGHPLASTPSRGSSPTSHPNGSEQNKSPPPSKQQSWPSPPHGAHMFAGEYHIAPSLHPLAHGLAHGAPQAVAPETRGRYQARSARGPKSQTPASIIPFLHVATIEVCTRWPIGSRPQIGFV